MIPDWLLKNEEYVPKKDNHKFLDKSIVSILHVISRIRRKGIYSNKLIYRLNPTMKVIFTFLNIILISVSQNFKFVVLMDIYLLFSVSTLDSKEKQNILLISSFIPIFTLIMLIPSLLSGNIRNSIMIFIKVIGTILSVNLLSYTTKWEHVTRTLKLFFIPDLFIWVMEITIKYIVILGEYSISMLYALKLRSIGKNNKKYMSLSKIMGNLFLKSKEMGEEMFSAMECRGFTGEYFSKAKFTIAKKDIVYLVVNSIFIALFIVLERG